MVAFRSSEGQASTLGADAGSTGKESSGFVVLFTCYGIRKCINMLVERLNKLRASASSQTLRKAKITSDQLQRRYSLVERSIELGSPPLNIAEASRWHGYQGEARQRSFEMAEPRTWLKHLPRKTSRLSRWHLSALIVEQFIAAQSAPPQDPHHMEPIPEDDSLQSVSFPLTRESSLERVRASLDVSSRSPRRSSDIESRQSADSTFSSIVSGSSHPVILRPSSNDQANRPGVKVPSISETTDRDADDRTPVRMDISPEKPRSNNSTHLSPDSGAVLKGTTINSGINLPKLVLPDSGGEDTNNEADGKSSRSPGARPRPRTVIDVHNTHQRFHSSSALRLPPTPPELRRDALKDLENEEVLRREYERKAMFVHILLNVMLY